MCDCCFRLSAQCEQENQNNIDAVPYTMQCDMLYQKPIQEALHKASIAQMWKYLRQNWLEIAT